MSEATTGMASIDSGERAGYVGRIPVRNVYLLMLYASDPRFQCECRSNGFDKNPEDLPDLAASLLADAVEMRLRHHLTVGYQPREAVLGRVRGRINILAMESRQLLKTGRVACRFEELTADSARNRFVRETLEGLSKALYARSAKEQSGRKEKTEELARRCRSLARKMKSMGANGTAPTVEQMKRERFGRNDAADRTMVSAAIMAREMAIPNEDLGSNPTPQPEREEHYVRELFQNAVGGFYAETLDHDQWEVRRNGSRMRWQSDPKFESGEMHAILPTMATDIEVDDRVRQRRILIDTKFTSIVRPNQYGKDRVKSEYLYQMYAYLRSQEGRGDRLADGATGLFLHPSIDVVQDLNEYALIQGHLIRFATVNLAASAEKIRARLDSLIREDPLCETKAAAGEVEAAV